MADPPDLVVLDLNLPRMDGREVLAVLPGSLAGGPRYFIELGWVHGRVIAIRDFRYVPYITREALLELVA